MHAAKRQTETVAQRARVPKCEVLDMSASRRPEWLVGNLYTRGPVSPTVEEQRLPSAKRRLL